MKIFRYDGSFVSTLELIFNLTLLNFLWVVFSIPVVTIGASTTALYTVTLKIAKKEEGYVFKPFLNAFKENFKKSTIVWVIFIIAMLWFAIMTNASLMSGDDLLKAIAIVEVSILFLISLTLLFVFPVIATYENTIFNTIKNAFLVSLQYLPYSVLMFVVVFVPIAITVYFKSVFAIMLFYWITVGVAGVVLVNSYIVNIVFEKLSKVEED